MKKFKNLYQKITDLDNIKLAHHNARKNKTHRDDVKKVDEDIEGFCKQIQDMLINHTYKTSEYFTFKLYEPKERIIFKLPYFPDRIVHHAIMNIMEPQMIPQTYSCIKKRGIHKVLKQIQHDLKDRENTKYCLKIDVRKFYPSVDHDILKQIIRIKVSDRELLQLLDEIIDSSDGVPIGNYLSQFFANLYLTYFDHWLKEDKQVKYYFRYADDIVILHNNKEYLWSLFEEMKQYIATLKLSFKDNYQVFKVEDRGISFVGYVIRHDYTLVRKNIKRSMCRKAARLGRKKHITVEDYKQEMCSHIGWLKHCNGINLLKKILRYKELLVYARRFSKQKL